MKYIVLLRGVNISGKNKVSMHELQKKLEVNEYNNIITYLNSGNIILESDKENKEIAIDVTNIIRESFKIEIPVYVISYGDLKEIYNNLPDFSLSQNKELYNNIIFIFPPLSFQNIIDAIGKPSENIDIIQEYKNIIYWSYDLNNYRKSNWWKKTASTTIKDSITIRTVNTIKRLLELCEI